MKETEEKIEDNNGKNGDKSPVKMTTVYNLHLLTPLGYRAVNVCELDTIYCKLQSGNICSLQFHTEYWMEEQQL